MNYFNSVGYWLVLQETCFNMMEDDGKQIGIVGNCIYR